MTYIIAPQLELNFKPLGYKNPDSQSYKVDLVMNMLGDRDFRKENEGYVIRRRAL
jgi:hypothetical protein